MLFIVYFQTGPFNLDSPPLTTYNQQLWLTCVMQAEHSNSKTTPTNMKVKYLGRLCDTPQISFYCVENTCVSG